jgi:hypothetical protein
MVKVMFVLLALASAGLAQSSSDGSFSVQHFKNANVTFSAAQMREAERLYQSACSIMHYDIPIGGSELHPQFTVIIGAERDEVHGADRKVIRTAAGNEARGKAEIWMTKWDPNVFAQGVVVLAFLDQVLTPDLIVQMGTRAVRYSNTTLNVAQLK